MVASGRTEDEPVATCKCQGGTIEVYEEYVFIDRSSSSMFEGKAIELQDVYAVEFSPGLVTGHVQVRELGVEPDEPGFLSHPVDENTLYFPRSKRDQAGRVRDAILERATGERPTE
ncbi:hypothetical protein VB773_05385 [Haloarculaceae archaeon H-GB2-1]|nr:hypothetical protein [Haloarculaceae archaeon H-GB1-1]MEA5389008.1 hypothetical protein [Haloarculaceae archaeon H-GB11]MEA5407067.1 hypothetical protein [Haloarculaceae archaeon H-GB2-1]